MDLPCFLSIIVFKILDNKGDHVSENVLGRIAIIVGMLFLSAELYGIKIIQLLDSQHGTWWSDAYIFEYAKQTPVYIAIIITMTVIGYGIWLCYKGRIGNRNNK